MKMALDMRRHLQIKSNNNGFTLIEIAIVIVIIGILTGGGISLMKILTERKARNATIEYLQTARQALISFAVNQGRLPWADSDGDGLENGPADGSATIGSLPYLTLQMAPADAYKRILSYEVNASLVSNRSAACGAIRAGLATRPQVVDADGVGTAFTVAAVLISAGPMDADRSGSVLDGINSGAFQGNNVSGTPNYLRHPPVETVFDDLTAYLGGNELFGRICEYVDLAVNNGSGAPVVVYDLNNNIIMHVVTGTTDAIAVLSGTRLELRSGAGSHIDSSPQTPIALAGRGETLTVP